MFRYSWLILLALPFLAFGGSLAHGFSAIDDSFLIVNNLAVRGITWENLHTVFTTYDPELYIPFVFVTWQIDYLLGGLDPFFFHLTNIVVHGMNAMLVFFILQRLTKVHLLSLIAAVLFAIHPLHTETVVWIAGLKDGLSAFFALLSTLCFLRYRQDGSGYILSVMTFLFALFAKAVVIPLPAALLLYDLTIGKRQPIKKLLIEYVPFFALSAVFSAIALGGKTRIIEAISTWEKILLAMKSSVFYLQKFFMPIDLSIVYPFRDPITLTNPEIVIPTIIILLLGALAFYSWWKGASWIAFGLGWYMLFLAPTFLNVAKGGIIFFAVDRYAYLPSVGLFFLLICVIKHLTDHYRSMGIIVGSTVIGMLFLFLSWQQTKLWEVPETLFAHAIELYPESVLGRVGLSTIQREAGREEDAFDTLLEGLNYGDHIQLRISAGLLYAKIGRVADAREQFQKAIEMDPEHPEPYYNLGFLAEYEGDDAVAMQYYQDAVDRDDSYVVARVALAKQLLKRGDNQQAEEHLLTALSWNKSSYEANSTYGEYLVDQGRDEEAKIYLARARMLEG